MVHVAQEMEREGFDVPLLIGGATTSRAHTAVKIAPNYRSSTVHVLDASRAVGVVSNLLNPQLRGDFDRQTRTDYERLREQHAAKSRDKTLLSIAAARANAFVIDWANYNPPVPEFTGIRAAEPSLDTLIEYVDWSPFFHTWELRGRYPAILEKPEAKKLFEDAQALLNRLVKEKLLTARAVYGFFPANAVGDDVELYTDESRSNVLTTFHFLRQQMDKAAGEFNHSLADFVSPRSGPGTNGKPL